LESAAIIQKKADVMKTISMRACVVLALLGGAASAAWAEKTRDESGRVVLVDRDASGRELRRTVLGDDGSRQVTSREYWTGQKTVKRSVEETRDRSGRPTARTTETFDLRGRLLERHAVSIDAAGRERGTRTTYAYDAAGERRESTTPVGR
jgi:YD repeat-containing protein